MMVYWQTPAKIGVPNFSSKTNRFNINNYTEDERYIFDNAGILYCIDTFGRKAYLNTTF